MRRARDDRGTGLIGTLAGVTVFLVLLLFAAQLLVNLYATSTVTAAAFDAARIVAGSEGGRDAEAGAERHARDLLGTAGESAAFEWTYDDVDGDGAGDRVRLRVQTPSPTNLLPRLDLPFQHIDRTVTVRVERLR